MKIKQHSWTAAFVGTIFSFLAAGMIVIMDPCVSTCADDIPYSATTLTHRIFVIGFQGFTIAFILFFAGTIILFGLEKRQREQKPLEPK